jgi:hypothetical protein
VAADNRTNLTGRKKHFCCRVEEHYGCREG